MTPQEVSQMIPVQLLYDDENDLINEFCKRLQCKDCEGTDHNGEPNGYGCELMEKWVNKWYGLIRENPKR